MAVDSQNLQFIRQRYEDTSHIIFLQNQKHAKQDKKLKIPAAGVEALDTVSVASTVNSGASAEPGSSKRNQKSNPVHSAVCVII